MAQSVISPPALAASGLYRMGLGEPVFIVAASLGLAGVAVMASRRLDPAPPVEPLEWRSLGAVWLVVVLITSLPFAHVGAAVDGGIAYRAYFSADLMTHLSVVAELQKGGFPLENPFYAGEPLGYYWLFFTLPATLGAITSNQTALLTTYLMGGLLFASLLFFTLRRTGLSGVIAAAGCAILLGAVSYEGVVAAVRDEPWTSINVDALSRWVYELISLDGLHRSLLYTPQHLFSYTLLLVLVLLVLRGEPRSTPMALLCGVLLGGMAGSSIVTAMLAGPWFILVLWRRRAARFWTFAVVTSTSALSFLAWYVVLGFSVTRAGRSRSAHPAFWSYRRCSRWTRALSSCSRRCHGGSSTGICSSSPPWRSPPCCSSTSAGYEGVWMAWRAGSVFLIALGLVAAQSFRRAFDWKTAIIVLPAVLTLALDVFNAQDVTNRELSPGGFPWTTVVSTGGMERTPMDPARDAVGRRRAVGRASEEPRGVGARTRHRSKTAGGRVSHFPSRRPEVSCPRAAARAADFQLR